MAKNAVLFVMVELTPGEVVKIEKVAHHFDWDNLKEKEILDALSINEEGILRVKRQN